MTRLAIANSLRRLCGDRFPRTGRTIMEATLRALPSRFRCELFPGIGIELNLDDLTQRSTYWQGCRFEEPTPQVLASVGAGASAFFDIGSNYGFFSYWMLHQLPEIEVYSFEPNPRTFDIVERVKTENSLDRLHPYHLGLSNEKGTLELHPGHEDSGHSKFTNHPDLTSQPISRVQVRPFDEWRQDAGLGMPAPGGWLAKIDVEGFELKVLQGMREALASKAFRLVAVELNEFTLGLAGTTPAAVQSYLAECGYQPLQDTAAGRRWRLERTANGFFVPRD